MPHFRLLTLRSHLALLTGLCLAAIVLVGAAPRPADAHPIACANATALPTKVARSAIAHSLLCRINATRRAHGLRPVRLSRRLSTAARRHSRDMVRRQYFSHTSLSGASFIKRIRRSGYLDTPGRWRVGEALAWGSGSRGEAGVVVRAWMRSRPHREVLLEPDFRQIGIGVEWGAPRRVGLPAATYTTDFGVRY